MPQYIFSPKAWSVGDVVAGVTVAATSLPQYIAYAELAGLAGHRGLITSGPPIVAFALITGSPCLCVGVTSITALMAHATLRGAEYKEQFGSEKWEDLLGAYAVFVGLASVILSLSGAAKLASYIPGPVKNGWKLGFAITVVAAQMAGAVYNTGGSAVKKMVTVPSGISGGAAAMYRLGWTVTHPYLWDMAPTALAVLTLFIVIKCKKILTKILRLPGIEVLLATAVGTVIALAINYAGDVVGMPPPAPPVSNKADKDIMAMLTGWVRRWPWEMPLMEVVDRLGGVPQLAISAVAFAGVDFLAIISVEAEKPPPGGWSPSVEMAGQGVGCVISGMVGSAPVGGSLSRSMVAGMTGASSPLMGFVSGIVTLCFCFPQVVALLAPTPKSVLAAIVLAAVLPSVVYPKDVLKMKGADAVVGWVTALSSAFSDPTTGFGVGCVVYGGVAASRHMLKGSAKKAD